MSGSKGTGGELAGRQGEGKILRWKWPFSVHVFTDIEKNKGTSDLLEKEAREA